MTHLEQALTWWRKADERGDEGVIPRRHARLLIRHDYIQLDQFEEGHELTAKGRAAIGKVAHSCSPQEEPE